jgi:hypothetical protein
MIDEISPRSMARLTAISSLVLIVAGVFAQGYVAETMINYRNAGTTAANILANETLFRTGFTVYLVEMTAQLVMSVLFYYLLKPVSRSGALVMTVIGLTGALMKIVGRLFFFSPLYLLHGSSIYTGFDAAQLNSLALMLLRINDNGAAIACAFFGPSTIIQGWLTLKSGYLPKWMGWIGIAGGIFWTLYYWPPLGRATFMIAALLGIGGALAQIVWLLVKGVDEERFRERVALSSSSIWR